MNTDLLLAPYLQTFFIEFLIRQKKVRAQTIAAYRDTFRLLLRFILETKGREPHKLSLADLNVSVILAFLDHLETQRHNTIRSRNTRLAAIRTFFRFVVLREPQCAQWVAQIMAIPVKRQVRNLVGYLTRKEMEVLIDTPNQASWLGRRNYALLLTLYNTGARVSEMISLHQSQVSIGVHSFVHLHGKGRKERSIPLWKNTAQVLSSWMSENVSQNDPLLFPNARGIQLTRQGVNYILRKIVQQAAENYPSLLRKHISPHILRHTTAMHLLQAGVDPTVIALWLGHENLQTTHIYVEADLQMKENALSRLAPIDTNTQRYKADDSLMSFLSSL